MKNFAAFSIISEFDLFVVCCFLAILIGLARGRLFLDRVFNRFIFHSEIGLEAILLELH